jgi:FixJ family two-component response regulator
VTNPPPRVFIVDDEEPVRGGLARLLRGISMPGRTFESAEAFLESYTANETGCQTLRTWAAWRSRSRSTS